MTAYGLLSPLEVAAALRRRGFAQSVARTAGFNFASTVAAGLGGIIIARAVGPTVRGEYAAVTSWFALLLIVGGMGQPAALCYYVARDPLRAREYVATSRAMMLTTGTVALMAGIILAPVLARGLPTVTAGYRIAFSVSIAAFVGASFTASLQARDLRKWNVVRVIQPVFSLIAIVVLWRLRRLTLDVALVVLAATMLVQFMWAYCYCKRTGLVPGRAHAALIRPLAAYRTAQIAALTPATLNAQLDQLVLSQTVPAADLGRYAIAVSLSLLPMPLVAAIGNVAFPRLAAQREVTDATRQLQRLSVLVSASLAAAVMVPLAGVSYWLVPLAFGPAYSGAVPLLLILTPRIGLPGLRPGDWRPAAGQAPPGGRGMGAGDCRDLHGCPALRAVAAPWCLRRGNRLDGLLRDCPCLHAPAPVPAVAPATCADGDDDACARPI